MPDPNNKTISATESSALFGASPYFTRWMLWHKFASGKSLDSGSDNRKEWGKKLQPLILEEVEKQMRLEVFPNKEVYHRRGLLGCTRDATIICPDRGHGALEIKCVFEYDVWMKQWAGGKMVPRHHEIQLQQQMFVGEEEQYQWGMIAAWVCADLYFFERKPIKELWEKLQTESAQFFASIEVKEEPEPCGSEIEIPWLTNMFPTVPGSVLDLSQNPDQIKTSETVSIYKENKETAAGSTRVCEKLRAELLALAKEHEQVLLPCGVSYRVKKSGKGKTIDAYVPDVLSPPPQPTTSVLHAG